MEGFFNHHWRNLSHLFCHTQSSSSVSSQVVSSNGKESRARAVQLYSCGCSQKDWKYFYFAGTSGKCILWWPFGLWRQGCSRETSNDSVLLHQGIRVNTQFLCTPWKTQNPPWKALHKHRTWSCNRDHHKSKHTHLSVPLKQSQVCAHQSSSLQISLLFV